MSKIRIYELAKQLGVANKDLVAKINSIGIEAKSHMGMLTEEEAEKVKALYQEAPKKEAPKKEEPKKEAPKQEAPKKEEKQNKPQNNEGGKKDKKGGKKDNNC